MCQHRPAVDPTLQVLNGMAWTKAALQQTLRLRRKYDRDVLEKADQHILLLSARAGDGNAAQELECTPNHGAFAKYNHPLSFHKPLLEQLAEIKIKGSMTVARDYPEALLACWSRRWVL